MKINQQTIKIGNSILVTIPKRVTNELGIKVGDIIEMDIINTTKRIVSYKCIKCTHYFDMENDNPYCPICGKDDSIKRVIEK